MPAQYTMFLYLRASYWVIWLCRLRDVLWDNCRLYLIMDYVEMDLREHMDKSPESSDMDNVKVSGGMFMRCNCL